MNAVVSDQREETIWRERDRSNKDSVTGLGEKCCQRFAKVYTGASGWMWEGEDEHPRESCIFLCFYKGKKEICTQLKVQPVQKGREIKSNSQFFHLFFLLSPQRVDLYFLVSTLKKKKRTIIILSVISTYPFNYFMDHQWFTDDHTRRDTAILPLSLEVGRWPWPSRWTTAAEDIQGKLRCPWTAVGQGGKDTIRRVQRPGIRVWHYHLQACSNQQYPLSVLIYSKEAMMPSLWAVCSYPESQMLSVQFSSVSQSCLTLCNPMNHSTPGLPVHHQLPESTQTHVHRVSDAIQPSHPLSSPFPPALNLSQHQSLFQWVNSLHQVAKVLEFQLQHQSFQWTPRTDLL